jgi:hypothetical protein
MKRMKLEDLLKAAAQQAEMEAPEPPTAAEMRRREAARQWWKREPGLFSSARRKLFSFEEAHADARADIAYAPESICRIPALVVRDEVEQLPVDVHVMTFEIAGDELTLKLRLSGTGIAREERLLQCAFVTGASDEPMAVAVADFTASKEASVHLYPDEAILRRCQSMQSGDALPFRLMLRPLPKAVPTHEERSVTECFRDFMSRAEKETTAHHRPGPAAEYVDKYWPECWTAHSVGVTLPHSAEERHEFISWIESNYGPAASSVLAQLAPLAPFSGWTELGRRSSFIQCVFLNQEGSDGWLARLHARLRPSDRARVYAENFIDPPGSAGQIGKASRSLFCGFGTCVLIGLWAIAGRKPYALWKRWLLRILIATALALTAFLAGSPAESSLLQPAAVMLLAVSVLAAITWLIFVTPLCARALQAGWKRRRLLKRSAVSLEILQNDSPLPLLGDNDASFTPAAAAAVLLGVDDGCPITREESWLWHALLSGFRERAENTVLTGVVTSYGFIAPVERLGKKCSIAVRAGVRCVVAPMQRYRAEITPGVRIFKSVHLADALLRVGGLIGWRTVLARIPAYLLAAVCLLGSTRVVQMAALAPIPRFAKGTAFQRLVTDGAPGAEQLHVGLDVPEYQQFAVRLLSHNLSNRWQRFYFDYRDRHAHAVLDLIGVNNDPAPELTGEIRLEQWRMTLLRAGAWVSVFRVPLPTISQPVPTVFKLSTKDRIEGGTMARQIKAALGCILALSACTKPLVKISAPSSEVPANGTLTLGATVNKLAGELTYRWLPGRGRCVPQESREIQTTYYPPSSGAGEDMVAVEVLQGGAVAANGQIVLHIVESSASVQAAQQPQPSPTVSVSINEIPRYDAVGGPIETSRIAGEVRGARPPEYRIILYSFTDHWYLQPEVAHPYTVIDANGRWAANIHLGSRYAALVVRGDYQPTVRTGELPRPGDDVIAVTEIDGRR